MPEYIEREAVMKKSFAMDGHRVVSYLDVLAEPAADVVPVVHGHWIIPSIIGGRAWDIPHCSACNGIPAGVDAHTKYCPHCGAKMDGAAT